MTIFGPSKMTIFGYFHLFKTLILRVIFDPQNVTLEYVHYIENSSFFTKISYFNNSENWNHRFFDDFHLKMTIFSSVHLSQIYPQP